MIICIRIYTNKKNEHINQVALEQYIQKRYINKLAETEQINPYIRDVVTKRKLYINGKEYINCLQILKKIKSNPRAMSDLATFRETTVHGDLTIDNILASTEKTNDFMIIDPNDENEISSAVIDFAKLFQSLAFGYEFLCRDNNPVRLDDNVINFENSTSASYDKLYKVARKIASTKLTKSEYKSIDFHIGMVYLRMLPYRANINPENILKFYAIAVISFNNFILNMKTKNEHLNTLRVYLKRYPRATFYIYCAITLLLVSTILYVRFPNKLFTPQLFLPRTVGN